MTRLLAVTFDLGGTLVEYEHVLWEELEAAAWRNVHRHLAARGQFPGTADDFTQAMMEASADFWRRAEQTQQRARLHEVFHQGLARLGLPAPNPDDFVELA